MMNPDLNVCFFSVRILATTPSAEPLQLRVWNSRELRKLGLFIDLGREIFNNLVYDRRSRRRPKERRSRRNL